MNIPDYLKNPVWTKLASHSSDPDLKDFVLTGSADMQELPSSPVSLVVTDPSVNIQKILDFGCGIGRNFKHYKKFHEEVHGYDLPAMVDRCRAMNSENINLLTSDWNEILSNTYDMVAAQFVFQHFLNPLHLTSLLGDISEITRYLYVSGRCYMDSPLRDRVFDIILSSSHFELIDSQPSIEKLRDFRYPSEEHGVALFESKVFKGMSTSQASYSYGEEFKSSSVDVEELKLRSLKTDNEEVDVILLADGNYRLTEDCILSILKHVKYPKYRMTLYDTGSTQKVVQQYQNLERDTPLLTYRSVSPFHFSSNYNYAIANSECSYVLILNNDTVALNDFVSEMMKYAINNKVGAVGSQLFYPNNTIQHGGQSICNTSTGKLLPHVGHYLHFSPATYQPNRFVDGVTCACALINKEIYKEVGGLSVEYKDIFQDTDLMLKLRDKGYEIYLSNDAKMIHYDGATRNPSNDPPTKVMMDDMDTFQDMWANRAMVKESKRGIINANSNPTFSFVTLISGDGTEYNEFLDSIQTDVEYEVIGIKNYDNFFDCPTGLNIGAELAVGKYIVFCHQDILLCPQWCEKVINHITAIEETDENWGVLGIAGVAWVDATKEEASRNYLAETRDGSINNTDEAIWSKSDAASASEVVFNNVATLDELLMICKNQYTTNTSEAYFDPELYGFHFYGADLCLSQRYRLDANSYVINCPVWHKSIDGTKNLQTQEQWRDYMDCRQRFIDKWQARGISQIVTTTFSKNLDGVFSVSPALRDK